MSTMPLFMPWQDNSGHGRSPPGKSNTSTPQHPTANAYLQGLEEIAAQTLSYRSSITLGKWTKALKGASDG